MCFICLCHENLNALVHCRTCQCKVLLLLHELAWGWSWPWCCHSWLGCRCRSWVVGVGVGINVAVDVVVDVAVGVVVGVRLTGGRVNLSGLGPNLLVYIYIKQHLKIQFAAGHKSTWVITPRKVPSRAATNSRRLLQFGLYLWAYKLAGFLKGLSFSHLYTSVAQFTCT